MFDEASARLTLEARQQLRKKAALPPLDIEAALWAMWKRAEREEAARAFENWKANNPDLVKAIREKALDELRTRGNKPADWRPTGVLSGGGLSFDLMVRERLGAAFRSFMARSSRSVAFGGGEPTSL
jgi:hypothetical protein